jgi:hypothetical protein
MSWRITPSFTQWTPALLTTALWLDADDASTVTESSGAVSQWNDKSGNARNATQASAGNRPTYQSAVINSRNVIRFSAASSQTLGCTGTAGSFNFLHASQGLLLAVGAVGTTADPNALYGITGNSGGFSVSRRGFNLLWDDRASVPSSNRFGTAAFEGTNTAVFNHGVPDILLPQSATIFGAATDATNATLAQRVTLLLNGSTYQGSTASATASTSNASFDWQVGDYRTGSAFFQGDIAEMVIVSGAVATPDRQKLEGYLAHKWGLTANLPSDHPYKVNPPAP